MGWSRAAIACATTIVALAPIAVADPLRTNQSVSLRAKPGEQAAVVATLPAGTEVVLVAETGRWLQVRAGRSVGYLTRTTVTGLPEQGGATGAWSAEPHDDWTARTDGELGRAAASRTPALAAVGADDDRPVRGAPPAFALRVDAAVGYRSLDMDFSSNGAAGLANYAVSADAPSLDVSAEAIARTASRGALVAIGARARAADGSPGIDYPGPSAPPGKIPFALFDADLWLRAGVRAGASLELSAQVGAHYDSFFARDVENAGMLPRERLLGATAGARLDFLPARSRVGVTAAADLLAIGSRKQTPGREDGQTSTAHALWATVLLRYQLGPRLSIYGGVSYERAWTRWSGLSVRQPDVTSASRIDTSQIVQLGLGADL